MTATLLRTIKNSSNPAMDSVPLGGDEAPFSSDEFKSIDLSKDNKDSKLKGFAKEVLAMSTGAPYAYQQAKRIPEIGGALLEAIKSRSMAPLQEFVPGKLPSPQAQGAMGNVANMIDIGIPIAASLAIAKGNPGLGGVVQRGIGDVMAQTVTPYVSNPIRKLYGIPQENKSISQIGAMELPAMGVDYLAGNLGRIARSATQLAGPKLSSPVQSILKGGADKVSSWLAGTADEMAKNNIAQLTGNLTSNIEGLPYSFKSAIGEKSIDNLYKVTQAAKDSALKLIQKFKQPLLLNPKVANAVFSPQSAREGIVDIFKKEVPESVLSNGAIDLAVVAKRKPTADHAIFNELHDILDEIKTNPTIQSMEGIKRKLDDLSKWDYGASTATKSIARRARNVIETSIQDGLNQLEKKGLITSSQVGKLREANSSYFKAAKVEDALDFMKKKTPESILNTADSYLGRTGDKGTPLALELIKLNPAMKGEIQDVLLNRIAKATTENKMGAVLNNLGRENLSEIFGKDMASKIISLENSFKEIKSIKNSIPQGGFQGAMSNKILKLIEQGSVIPPAMVRAFISERSKGE